MNPLVIIELWESNNAERIRTPQITRNKYTENEKIYKKHNCMIGLLKWPIFAIYIAILLSKDS